MTPSFFFRKNGHCLVEVSLAIGLISSGILTLGPLLGIGLKQSRQAQENRMAAHIAETLLDEARQGLYQPGVFTLNQQGNRCAANQAVYRVTVKTKVTDSSAVNLSLRIVPLASPKNGASYAALIAAP